MTKLALLSTSDPHAITGQCRVLAAAGWRFIATRETVEVLRACGLPVEDVSVFTRTGYEFGVPPTLHPKIEQALAVSCPEPIDLIYDVPYPLSEGRDIGGRTLLALGIKGKRLVANSPEDLGRICDCLSAGPDKLEALREELLKKVGVELAEAFGSMACGDGTAEIEIMRAQRVCGCKEGENPYQVPCELFGFPGDDPLSLVQLTQVGGERPCFTNLADTDNILRIMGKLKAAFFLHFRKIPFMAIAAKHGNPCGAALDWDNPGKALEGALWGNAQAVWGGEIAVNFGVDEPLSRMLLENPLRETRHGDKHWMPDIVAAESFQPGAVSILGKRAGRKLFVHPECSRQYYGDAESWQYRFVRGGYLRQKPADFVFTVSGAEWTAGALSGAAIEDAFIAWAVSYGSFSGGNEIALAQGGKLIGLGGGPSTLMAASYAVSQARECGHDCGGAVFAADAFFPFTDAPAVLIQAGVRQGIVPAGGKHHQDIRDFFLKRAVTVGFVPAAYRGFCRH